MRPELLPANAPVNLFYILSRSRSGRLQTSEIILIIPDTRSLSELNFVAAVTVVLSIIALPFRVQRKESKTFQSRDYMKLISICIK
jgi:hypothetical protein